MQQQMPLISSMQGPPKAAPALIVRQVESEAQAIDVSIDYCGFKAGFIAASLGVSEQYVSLLRHGKRPIPKRGKKREQFIEAFCRITGTALLKQAIRQTERELEEAAQLSREQINARIAAQLRAA